MPPGCRHLSGIFTVCACLAGFGVARSDPPPAPWPEISRLDLTKSFETRSKWSLVATQGPNAVDYGDNTAPGALHLCLEKGLGGPCTAEPTPMPPSRSKDSYDGWEPHYMEAAKLVYPAGRSAPPLLMIVTASMHAGDGGQVVVTQLLNYDRVKDAFQRVYTHETGTNNNEEVRFITSGPLEGAVISAEPTENAPYGYWIEVDRLTAQHTYRPVLKYRSATRYGDGNPLAVIDSELPNIEHRLGLWNSGSPPPLPAKRCPKPHLKDGALWCE